MVRRKTSHGKLLNAALTVFSQTGYASSSVSDIIKEAGVARGTFYLYFDSKRNAFEQVLAFVLSEMEKLSPETLSNSFNTPLELYERIYFSYNGFIHLFDKNRDFADIVFKEAIGVDKGFDAQLEQHYESHRANIRVFLEGVKTSGLARTFNLEITIQAIIGAAERCARIFTGRRKNGFSLEEIIEELADFEFGAICNVSLTAVKSQFKKQGTE